MFKKIFFSIIGIIGLILIIGWLAINFFPEKLVPFLLKQQIERQIEQIQYGENLLADTENITVFIVDRNNAQILVWNKDGSFNTAFGSRGIRDNDVYGMVVSSCKSI